jgi:hypothetical protein
MRSAVFAVGLLTLPLAIGCAEPPKLTVVKGKLTDGGKTLLTDKKGGVTISFLSVSEPGRIYPGVVSLEDDTYYVKGPEGKGIPFGKYRVSLNLMTSRESTPAIDKMNQQYGAKTPIEVDVTGLDLDIDLTKYKPK